LKVKRIALETVIMAALVFAAAPLWAASPIGKWKTIDEKDGKAKSIVEVYEQNGKIYGKFLEMLNPADKNKVCDKCEGADKGKPIVGMVFIKGLKADGDEYTGGTILDPGSGKIYKGKLKVVEGGKKLKASGCISFICKGQTWLRVE
jgi:uncharacterized protein (DUF2147 family)